MIVDVHVHHWLHGPARDPVAAADALIAAADRAGIDWLCLLGNVTCFGFRQTARQVRFVNDTTIDLVTRRPERLVGMCFLNPRLPAAFLKDEIARCVADGPLRGVKLEADLIARDRRLGPIMTTAARLDVPVLHHCWYKTVRKLPDESDPSDIANLAGRFPGTTIIMAHLTAAGVRGVLDVQPHENVYVDTSGSQPVAGVTEYAVEKLGGGRILFGSDALGRDLSCQLAKVLGADISRSDRELICGANAARLLKLDQ